MTSVWLQPRCASSSCVVGRNSCVSVLRPVMCALYHSRCGFVQMRDGAGCVLRRRTAASGADKFMAKQEEHGPQDAQARPEVIQAKLLFEVEQRERNEDGQRDYFLDNL